MKKRELAELRKQLANEFRLTGNATGCDVLSWYCDSGSRYARELRSMDTFEGAKANLRTVAAAPFDLLRREERAVDAVLTLLKTRGLDVSRAQSVFDVRAAAKREVLSTMTATRNERPDFEGLIVRRHKRAAA